MRSSWPSHRVVGITRWAGCVFLMSCGLVASEEPRFSHAVATTAPWVELALPIETGIVSESSSDVLSVVHHDTTRMALLEDYGTALRMAGWVQADDHPVGVSVSQVWKKQDKQLFLVMQPRGAAWLVSLSGLAF